MHPTIPDEVGRVVSARRFADGNTTELWLIDLANGRRVVAKLFTPFFTAKQPKPGHCHFRADGLRCAQRAR